MTTPGMMGEEWRETSGLILTLTLEIITLLTGQSFAAVKSGDLVAIMAPQRPFMMPKRTDGQKILGLIAKMMELLSKQIPTICRDVYLSSEEYPGGQKAAMMEGHPAGGSDKRTTPERRLHPPHPGDSTQTGQEIPHHGQSLGVKQTSVNNLEKTKVKSEEDLEEHTKLYKAAMMEHHPAGGSDERTTPERRLHPPHPEASTQEGHPAGGSDKRTTPERRLHPPHHPGDSTQEHHPSDPSWVNKPPEPSPHPPYSWESTKDCQKVPHHGQKAESPSLLGSQDSIAEIQSFRPNKIKIHVENSETLVMVGQWSTSGDGAMVVSEEASVTSHQHSPEKAGSRTAIKMEEVELSVKSHQWPPEENMRVIKVEEESSRCGLESVVEVGKMETNNIKEEEDSVRSGRLSNSNKEEGLSREVGFVYDHDVNTTSEEHLMDEDFAEDPFGEDSRNSSVMEIRNPSDPPPMNPPAAGAGSEGLETVSCSECGMSFISEYRLHRHQRIHFPEGPFPCSECGKIFTQRRNLFRHMSTHSVPKPYQCPECGKCFSRKSYLVHHWRSHTVPDHEPTSEEHFMDDELTETSLGPNSGDPIPHPGHLNPSGPEEPPSEEPRAVSSDDMETSQCVRSSTSESVLQKRRRIPLQQRPYPCWECGKSFTLRRNLIRHQATHSGEKPFLCHECGKSFSRKSYLVNHQKIHTEHGHDVANFSEEYSSDNGHDVVNPSAEYLAENGHEVANPSEEILLDNGHDVVNPSEEYSAENGHDVANPSEEYLSDNGHDVVNPSAAYLAENGQNTANPLEDYWAEHGHDSANPSVEYSAANVHDTVNSSEEYWAEHGHDLANPSVEYSAGNLHEAVNSSDEYWAENGHNAANPSEEYYISSTEDEVEIEDPKSKSLGESSITVIIDPELCSPGHSPDPSNTNESSLDSMNRTANTPRTSRNNKFSCSECGKYFTSSYAFQTHQRVHTGERPFPCSVCGRRFTRKENLRRHERVHTGEKPFPCPQCGKRFSRKPYLADHLRTHIGQTMSERLIRGGSSGENSVTPAIVHSGDHLTNPSASISMAHNASELQNNSFSCSECGISFRWFSEFEKHWQTHSGEAPFSKEGHLQDRQTVNLFPGPYSCTECGVSFTDQSEAASHQLLHAGQQSGVTFMSELELDKLQEGHAMVDHTGHKPFSCWKCGEQFAGQARLDRHLALHAGEDMLICAVCGKTCRDTKDFSDHQRSHTNDRLFSCTECGLKFTTKSSLVQHSRGHSREHSIEHSGEKPYSCPECHFRYICRLDLMIHLRSHTGEKPFSCSKCGKTFNQRSSLYSHHRTCCQ